MLQIQILKRRADLCLLITLAAQHIFHISYIADTEEVAEDFDISDRQSFNVHADIDDALQGIYERALHRSSGKDRSSSPNCW